MSDLNPEFQKLYRMLANFQRSNLPQGQQSNQLPTQANQLRTQPSFTLHSQSQHGEPALSNPPQPQARHQSQPIRSSRPRHYAGTPSFKELETQLGHMEVALTNMNGILHEMMGYLALHLLCTSSNTLI
jgi:hypothetical protein